MDVFQALLQLILDQQSLDEIKKRINSEDFTLRVKTYTSKTKTEINKAASELSRLSKVNTMQTWADSNSKAMKKYGNEISKLIAEMGNMDIDLTVDRSKEITRRFKEIQVEARNTGDIGKTSADKLKNAWSKFGSWGLATGMLTKLFSEIRQGVDFIKELDDALTDVSYTSNISASSLKELGNSSVNMAKDLKTSASNVLEAVKIYSTANSSAEDIMRKSEPAIMLSNVSGMSGTESAKTIQTAINQFGLKDTEESLLDVTDTLQYVSGQLNYDFTEGIKEIVEGIEASGSVAKSAGLDFYEYSTMVGLAVEQTGQSGSTIGNAYKTIFSRITSASKGQGTLAEDLSNAEAALRNISVQVRDSDKDFRDLSDIMADIGKVWDSLEDSERQEVGYHVAGTRQLNVLNSLFGAYERYEKIMENIDKRTGTTEKNQAEYEKSLAGHIGNITSTTQSIWNNVIDSNGFKNVLKLFGSFLDIVDSITKSLGAWGTIGVGAGLFTGIKNVGQGHSVLADIAYPC